MEENIVIDLNPNEVNIALLTYFKKTNVNIKYELTLNNDNLNIIFYLDDGINKEIISYQDLENALKNYIYRNDYEFKEFKYIGGIHKTGYYFDNTCIIAIMFASSLVVILCTFILKKKTKNKKP